MRLKQATIPFWTQHLFNNGKSSYERSNKTQLNDYTYKQLLKLVRREQQGKDVPPVAGK